MRANDLRDPFPVSIAKEIGGNKSPIKKVERTIFDDEILISWADEKKGLKFLNVRFSIT